MKQLAVLAMVVALTACAAAGAGGSLETKVIKQGSYAMGDVSEPQAMAARDEETLKRLWSSLIGTDVPQLPADTTIVFLFAGSKPTGGYSIATPTAAIENGILVVTAPVQGPPPGAMVTQALTSPFLVLEVNTRTFDDLLWKR